MAVATDTLVLSSTAIKRETYPNPNPQYSSVKVIGYISTPFIASTNLSHSLPVSSMSGTWAQPGVSEYTRCFSEKILLLSEEEAVPKATGTVSIAKGGNMIQ